MLLSVFRTLVIYIVVVLAMRLMGKRQLGELQPAELVTTFLISNVASLCIDEPDLPLLASLVPIFLIVALEILNSTLSWFFPRYATLLFGKPVTVIRDGQILQSALRELRISPSDLVEAMRGKDVFSPEEITWGVIEPNGSLSIALDAQNSTSPMLPLLVDGLLYPGNLAALHFNETWLDELLNARGLRRRDVLVLLHNGKELLLVQKKAAPKGGTMQA